MRRAAALLALACAAGGCAAPARAPVPAPAPPAAAGTPAPVRPAPGAPAAAVVDSAPSAEALAVLATIPEPLGGATAMARPAPPEAYDTLRAGRDVPVPARTEPLARSAPMPEAPPPAAAGAPPAAAAPAAAAPDTCWRVQVAAPAERERGRSIRDAAESLLMVPMLVDREGGRHKVRTRDCLSRAAAESLRDRALASGFPGVFLVRFGGGR